MNIGKGSAVILTIILSVLCGGECKKNTETELSFGEMSCNSLTVMWARIPEVVTYNLEYKLPSKKINLAELDTNETMFDITQLLPNTTYTVRVRDIQRNKIIAKANFTTLPRTGIGDNVTVMVSTNRLEIENKFTGAKITCWISGSDTVKNITISGMSREVVDELSSNTTYSVDCVEVDEEGQYQCMEYNETVTTLLEESPGPTVPGQTTNITVNKTCDSLTLSWLPPGEDGGSNVTDYIVTVVNGTEDGPLLESVPAGGNTTVRITPLKPNIMYTVHIRARNSAGLGIPAVVNATTEELKVSRVDYKSESAREVTLRLLGTSGNFTCTVLVESTNSPVFNSTVSAGTDVTIDTLTPNTTYSIRCTGIEDQCVEVNEMFTTAIIKVPGQPTNITVNKTCNSLTLSWLPPGEDGGSIITDYNVTVVNGTEDGPLLESVPTGGNNTVRITPLKPNTMYTVHIRARNSVGLGPPVVKSVTTEELKFSKVDYKSELAREVTLRLLGTSGNFTCTVLKESTNSPVFNSTVSAGTDVTIGPLTPNTTYSTRCTGIEDQCVEVNEMFITVATVPGQPTNITVDKTCDSLTLSWLPPGEDGGSIITDYNVTVVDGTEDGPLLESVPTGGNTTVTITSLKPDSMYTVHIRARNSDGLGPPAVVNVTTEELKVREVNTTPVSATEVTVRLQGSSGNFTCTVLKESTNSPVFNSTTVSAGTDITIGPLTPNTTYSIRCTGMENQCVEVNEMFTTAIIKGTTPGAPNIIANMTTCTNITLHWIPPDNNRDEIQDYIITYYTGGELANSVDVSGDNTSATLPNLKPNTLYTIQVRARNSVGTGDADSVNVTTMGRSRGDDSLDISSLSRRSLQFSHTLPQPVYYTCERGGSTEQFNITERGYNLTGLRPDTTYTIDCVAYLNGEDYCLEVNTSARAAPGKVKRLAEAGLGRVDGDQINQSISWSRPSNHTSQLNYIVKYGPSSVVDRPTHPSVSTTTSSNTKVTLTLPIPTNRTVYNVWVAAVSDVGQGEYKMIKIIYKKPSPPKNITVINKTCNSLSVQWSPPSDTGGLEITGYMVDVAKNSFTTNTTMTRTDITNLSPNTTYQVKVETITVFKSKFKSINITTQSHNELQLHLRPFSSTGLNLTITPPHNKDGVNYTCTLSPGNKTLSGNVTLTDLSPNTTYSVRCLVENGEDLCYEGIRSGRTFPSVPEEEPSNVTVTKTKSNQFTVKWGPSRGYEYNQDIRGYNVKYWRTTESEDNATTKNVTTTTYTATGLDTNTVYTFRVAAYTEEGIGAYSGPVNISTIPKVESISVSELTNTTAEVKWAAPSGDYQVWLELSVGDDFQYGNRTFGKVDVTNSTQHQLSGLDPYRSYTIEMYLVGDLGNGSKEKKPFRTLGSDPIVAPQNLSVKTHKKQVTLQWGIPPVSGRNGIITSYEIHWRSANTQTSPIIHNVSQPNFTHPEQISRTIQGLAPYTTYTWRVAAVNVNGTGPFSVWDNFTTQEDVPGIVQDLKVTAKTPSNITVEWKQPSTPNGVIIQYKVCSWILDRDKCSQQSNTTGTEETTLTGLDPGVPYKISVTAYTSAGPGPKKTLNKIIFTKELPPEQTVTNITIKWINATTVNISWIPLGIHQARGFPSYRVTILREGTLLENRTTTHFSVVIGELNNNRLYTVTVNLITGGGEGGQSEPVNFGSPTVTQAVAPDITLVIVIIVVVILLILICLIIVIVVLLCKFKQQKKIVDDLDEVLSMKEIVEEVDDSIIALQNMQRKEPIPKHLFSDHVRNMHRDKDKDFISEFASLTKEPPVKKEAAENNRMQNRYINIYPYDYSRVVLTEPGEVDYINAAYIDGYKKPKRYIATQGPIQNTIEDFWEMVWEQKSPMIIMLTRLVEGTKVKCELYWNEEINQPYEPGRGLTVTLTKHTIMTGFEVRHFKLEKASDTRDPLLVKQFLYTVWPDHGVPQYSSSMVKFILQQIKPEMEKTTAPIVVHCSAGAGRTGTLIAIERTLAQLEEDDNNINIFEIVESMRSKRTQMVQNTGQYIYVHDAINDYVTCGDTVIVAHELGQKITEMSRMNQRTRKTGFGGQFKILGDLSPEICDQDIEFSKRPDIEQKNRYTHLYPYCDNFIHTEDDENYVNATYIGGYYGQSGFIAAQGPLKNTIEDTWNVIRQQSCLVVVVLGELVEQNQSMCEKFWPEEFGVPMEVGYMKISLMNTIQNEQAEKHSINISIEEGDVVQKIEIYHYKAWEKHGRPDVSSLLKLMGDVQKSQQGHTGPVMVMCDDGMSRTGVFITVMSEIDRVKVEGEMDIFHTVKAARTARPYIVSTVNDYECCHEILQQYLESFDTYANFQ